jgi:hypothetical protein
VPAIRGKKMNKRLRAKLRGEQTAYGLVEPIKRALDVGAHGLIVPLKLGRRAP